MSQKKRNIRVHLQVRRKHHRGRSRGEKVLGKNIRLELGCALAASDKGSCFEQEKLLALDEGRRLTFSKHCCNGAFVKRIPALSTLKV